MEDSVGSAIEKIKLLEQDKEVKLKEKRELEAAFASLSRAIRDNTTQADKSEQEQKSISSNITVLRTQITTEKIRRDAMTNQLHIFNKELEDLRVKSNEGISNVWKQRSSFCQEIQAACENYDVWALLMKPARPLAFIEPIKKQDDSNITVESENRLKIAVERRESALKERNLLKAEPDSGEEFIRIKNALRYSLEKIEELRKTNIG